MSDDVVSLTSGTGMMVPGIGGDDDVGNLHVSVLKAFDAVQARWPTLRRTGRFPFCERWGSWRG